MDSFITTFHIDWHIIIAQAINFAIVFAILYGFALKPLKKLMAEREANIARGVHDAKTNAKILESTQKEYEAVLAKARTEAHAIFQEGKREAEENKALMIEQATQDVEAMVLNGKKRLEAEKAKMVDEAKKEIVSLVVRATEKLLETHEDPKFNDKAVGKLKEV